MLNLVAVNASGAGDLRAWPFGQAAPAASAINYALPGSGLNIANGVVLGLCDPKTTTCNFGLSAVADVRGAGPI